MKNTSLTNLINESTLALEHFAQQMITLNSAFASMVESGGDLTSGDRADLKDYRRDSHLFENFLNMHKANKSVFEKAFNEEEISLQQFDAWTDALNKASLVFSICNVNASAVKENVEDFSESVKDCFEIGGFKLQLRSYISASFDEFKVQDPADEIEEEIEKE